MVTVTTPGRTVTHIVVHVHTTTVTHTQTVTAPEPPTTATIEREGVGSSSHAEDSQFCSEHTCIGNFQGEEGTVVKCSDGSYSHAGGISGACSHHGGES